MKVTDGPLLQLLACSLFCSLLRASTTPAPQNRPKIKKNELLPKFNNEQQGSASYYLPSGEDWRPGGSTLISVLMADQPLQFRTDPTGSKSGLQSVRLLYKCSSTDADFKEVLLESGNQSSTHCQPLRPFVLERVSASLYRLTLLRENGVAFEQALRHSLEFRLRLSFNQGELESASLFVFNFDALTKIPPAPVHVRDLCRDCSSILVGVEITEFLHRNSYGFFYSMFKKDATWIRGEDKQARLRLFREELLNAFRKAKPLVRSLLSVALFHSRNCSNFTEPRLMFASAGLGRSDDVGLGAFRSRGGYLLDPDNGYLHFEDKVYEKAKYELRALRVAMDVCLSISIKDELWNYQRVFRVHKMLRSGGMAYYWYSRIRKPPQWDTTPFDDAKFYFPCYPLDGNLSSQVNLPANLRNLALSCPFACYEYAKYTYTILFTSKNCSSTNSTNFGSGPPCTRVLDASTASCRIKLDGPSSAKHEGDYTIIVEKINLNYTYHVSVASLPVFQPDPASNGTLTFSPKFSNATLGCSVTHSGLTKVDITPRFRMQERFKPGSPWIRGTPLSFSVTALDGDSQGLAVSTKRTDTRTDLTVSFNSKKKEDWSLSWKVVFECLATVGREDADNFGLTQYEALNSWNLVPDEGALQMEARSLASALSAPVQTAAPSRRQVFSLTMIVSAVYRHLA